MRWGGLDVSSSHRIIPSLVRLRDVRSKGSSLASLAVRFCATGTGLFRLAQHSNPGRAAPDADRRELADTADAAVGQAPSHLQN